MHSYDAIIAGGGMVGLAAACCLGQGGLRVAVLEQGGAPREDDPQLHLRVSAINAASERLFERLGVLEYIRQRAASCRSMQVWERDSFAQITFKDCHQGIMHLSSIVENQVIRYALWERATQINEISLITGASLQQSAFGDNEAFVTLNEGSMMTARLMIAADGAHSQLREQAGIPLTFWDYDQHALIATIRTQQAHDNIARQVFHSDGILAFLPLRDPHLCSIVWSLPPQEANRYRAMNSALFCQQLAVTFDMRLGLCELESERQTFPLMARFARNFAAHRLVLVGDAAHTIHPLAGQGVNLGFMDAAELAGEIIRLQRGGKDIGEHLWLRRYERNRKQSAAVMLAGMQGFRQLFAGDNPLKKLVRDIGLTMADKVPGVKSQLLAQASGLRGLPEWLR